MLLIEILSKKSQISRMSIDETFPKRYEPKTVESKWQDKWYKDGHYSFRPNSPHPVFSIDTPPPTISGRLHIGHVFSYTHTEIISRYRRMRGFNVYYPFGYDDNGLPTELLTEKESGLRAHQTDRRKFRELCLETGKKYSGLYSGLWKKLGFSCDFESSYSTISSSSQKISQWSFVDLHKKGFLERRKEPALWCTKCVTSFAQAEIEDQPLAGTYYHLPFSVANQDPIVIATTRPELLAACVALFVHPEDERFQSSIGKMARVPFFDHEVAILADEKAMMTKGTGAVMCCTFGDTTDIFWWRKHKLPLREAITKTGKMTALCGPLENLSIAEAKKKIVEILAEKNLVLKSVPISAEERVVNTHERCGTPVEFLLQPQWFIKVCEQKENLLAQGRKIKWFPEFMRHRFENWVENLSWDWAISRQRAFGVPIPAWYSADETEVYISDPKHLPVDPTECQPPAAGKTGEWIPDRDVLDTWATSSITPLINANFTLENQRPADFLPMSMRPQAHDIIRTWAFYTIAKSYLHFGHVPWKEIVISGHVKKPSAPAVDGQQIAGQEFVKKTKISKSKDGETYAPEKILERHSADAVRLWAAGASLGIDILFDENGMTEAAKFLNKLWNASRFALLQLEGFSPSPQNKTVNQEDHWIRGSLKQICQHYIRSMDDYESHLAKVELDKFFWISLCDNYIEFVKCRLAAANEEEKLSSMQTIYDVLLITLKLYAPYAPHITEEIYQIYFAQFEKAESIHALSTENPKSMISAESEAQGDSEYLIAVISAIRQGKSQRQIGFKVPAKSINIQSDEKGVVALNKFSPIIKNFCSAAEITISTSENLSEVWPTSRSDTKLQIVYEAGAVAATKG